MLHQSESVHQKFALSGITVDPSAAPTLNKALYSQALAELVVTQKTDVGQDYGDRRTVLVRFRRNSEIQIVQSIQVTLQRADSRNALALSVSGAADKCVCVINGVVIRPIKISICFYYMEMVIFFVGYLLKKNPSFSVRGR